MAGQRFQLFLIQCIAFLSAFLLFQIEPIMGKILLPNFGGSYLVWGSCVVFFQAVLLLGYGFAHWGINKISFAKYRVWHGSMLFLPFLFFPGKMLALKFSLSDLPLVIEVFIKLLVTIGPVFFILSTMSIVCQAWLAASHLPEKKNPYTLFGISNLGSFAGLLTYPFLIEMYFDLYVQQNFWRAGYVMLVLLNFGAFAVIRLQAAPEEQRPAITPVAFHRISAWLLYSAAAVMLFLAVTNMMTSEIAPIPLLWIVPLSIYLLSFVLNFKARPLWPGWLSNDFSWLGGVGILFYFIMGGQYIIKMYQVIFLFVFLFLTCMFCQNRVYKSRPETGQLTFFYFIISLGGFLGGIVATWIVPLISTHHMGYFYGILCVAAAFFIEERGRFKIRVKLLSPIALAGIVALLVWGPVWVKTLPAGLGIVAGLIVLCYRLLNKDRIVLIIALLAPVIFINALESRWTKLDYIYKHRNYYGTQKVFERSGVRYLLHGTTIHGAQFQDPKMSYVPLMYYNPQSPVAKLLITEVDAKDIAIIGLGTGALTMYLKGDQKIDMFELDPEIYKIAQEYFSYLERSPAQLQTVFGDARLSLEKMDGRLYDLIIIDAFSGDAVPIHLITRQAIALYKRHLKPSGIIVFHLTNRYIDLLRPFYQTAKAEGAYVLYKHDRDYISKVFGSDWAAITWDMQTMGALISTYNWGVMDGRDPEAKPLSDAFSTLLPYFKWQQFKSL